MAGSRPTKCDMADRRLKFASLFSGCGGFDLGFAAAGFQSCGAYDLDPDAINNFTANIGNAHLADLTNGLPNERRVRGVSVLIAGPPCQGFSTAGKRQVNDKRNQLLTLTGHLAHRIRPHVLVVENVAGALAGEHACYMRHLNGFLRSVGYKTNIVSYRASDLGMAQLRRRVFFFAWRTSHDIEFDLPQASAGKLHSALCGVDSAPNHNPKPLKRGSREWQIAKRIAPGQKLCNVRGGAAAVPTWDIPEVFGPVTENERTVLELLRRLRRCDRKRNSGDADPVSIDRLEAVFGRRFHQLIDSLVTKGYLRRFGGAVDLAATFNGKFRRLHWDKPSCTVDTRFGSPRYFLHPSQQRGFTVREAARVQGFPDDYVFVGSEIAQYRLIGNAVPPPIALRVAQLTKSLLPST